MSAEIAMSHTEFRARFPETASYERLLGAPDECAGQMRRMDAHGTLECDHCHARGALRPGSMLNHADVTSVKEMPF